MARAFRRNQNHIEIRTRDNPFENNVKAVREEKVYVTESNQYFNRPGPRLVESLEILAEIFYPETFQFGHQGTGWQKLETHL